jgi:glyoxylase I family protein
MTRDESVWPQAKEASKVAPAPASRPPRRIENPSAEEPGGWNRVVLKVADLPGFIAQLEKAGVRLRNEMETGPGGRQIQIEDVDGNPIELFEPAR